MRPVPEKPGPGQESVWDYPRPPALVSARERVEIHLGGVLVAAADEVWKVLETSHPPTYYLPREAFAAGTLRPTSGSSHCEWKGQARYFDVVAGGVVAERSAWTYPEPTPGFLDLAHAVAVMPAAMERCTVDGEVVVPQPGGFYGGWITSKVSGPFKGEPGTWGW